MMQTTHQVIRAEYCTGSKIMLQAVRSKAADNSAGLSDPLWRKPDAELRPPSFFPLRLRVNRMVTCQPCIF